jgi:hypothetical protein
LRSFDWDRLILCLAIRPTKPRRAPDRLSRNQLLRVLSLGEIVGSATAGPTATRRDHGANQLPHYLHRRARHQARRSRQHLLGIQPTIPALRTIAGIIAGRDEVLEKALAYVRSAK